MRLSMRLFILSSFIITGCGRNAPKPDEHERPAPSPSARGHEEQDHRHAELPHKIELSKEVIQASGIKVVAVAKEVLSEALTLPGEISADPDRLARISSPAAGRIEMVSFREGAAVKKGDVLAVVKVPEVAGIRASYRTAQAKAKAARVNAQRLRALLAEGLTAEQPVIDAETEAEALDIEAKSLGEQLGALGAGAAGASSISVRTPISGTVVGREAVVGQPASADQVLGTIADLDEVWFLARVFEKDLGKLKVGALAEVHLNAYPNEHFAGSVEYVGQQIDSVARTVTARVRLKNRDGLLRLGLFGNCQVASGDATKAPQLVVARSAVTDVPGKSVVFVRHGEREFELHEVTLGEEALGRVGVLAGLREGEEVVTEGVFTLKSIVLKGSIAEDEH